MNQNKFKKIISFIVCSNGYGHLKRVISVVNQLNLIDKIINQKGSTYIKESNLAKPIKMRNKEEIKNLFLIRKYKKIVIKKQRKGSLKKVKT